MLRAICDSALFTKCAARFDYLAKVRIRLRLYVRFRVEVMVRVRARNWDQV